MYEEYPRVTKVLQNLHNPNLMEWSNFLGLRCRIDYNEYMTDSQQVGTYTHNKIERNMRRLYRENKDDIVLDTSKLIRQSDNAYFGFELFKRKMEEYNVKIENISNEMSLVSHKYKFRGTCDWLCMLNGELFLIDFKTSNDIYPKMFLQLSAYTQMLNERGIYPKRCGILSLIKKRKYDFKFTHVDSDYLMNNLFPIFLSLLEVNNGWNNFKKEWENCQAHFETTTW